MIRLGAIGDVVRTLPAAARVRAAYPGAQLAWLVEPAASGVLAARDWIDEVIVFPRGAFVDALRAGQLASLARRVRYFLGELRGPRFDLVIDFHSIARSGVLSRASGAPVRVAFAPPLGRELGYCFANRRARLRPGRMSRYERNDGLADFLGAGPEAARPLEVDAALRRAFAQSLQALRKPAAVPGPASGPPVVLHPGTGERTPHKRYTVSSYAAVARGLQDAVGVRSVVASGPGRGEREVAAAIVAASGGAAELAPETATLEELAALLAACPLFVGSDSGPLHLASAVGTPVVQILGPTDPVHNVPGPGSPSRTVHFALGCSPCRRGCAEATCMRVVAPRAVVAAASELLAEVAAPARGALAGGR